MSKLFQIASIQEKQPLPSFKEVMVGLEELDDSTNHEDLDLYIAGATAGVEGIEELTNIISRLEGSTTLDQPVIAATEAHIDYIMYTLGYTQDEASETFGLESFNDQKEDTIAGLEEKKDGVFKRTLAAIKKYIAGILKRIKKSAIGKFVAEKFRTVYAAIASIPDYIVGMKIETELGFTTMQSLGKFVDDYKRTTTDIEKVLPTLDYSSFTTSLEHQINIDIMQEIHISLSLDKVVNKTDFDVKRKCKVSPVVDYVILLEIMGIKAVSNKSGEKPMITYSEHPVAEKLRDGITKLEKIAKKETIPQGSLAEFKTMCVLHAALLEYVELGPKAVMRSVTNIAKSVRTIQKERKEGKKK